MVGPVVQRHGLRHREVGGVFEYGHYNRSETVKEPSWITGPVIIAVNRVREKKA